MSTYDGTYGKNYEILCDLVAGKIPELLRAVLGRRICGSSLEDKLTISDAYEHLAEYQKHIVSKLKPPTTIGKSQKREYTYEDFDLSLMLRSLDILARRAELDVAICSSCDQIKHSIWTLFKKEQSASRTGSLHIDEQTSLEMIEHLHAVIRSLKKECRIDDIDEGEVVVGYGTRDWIRCIGRDEEFFDDFLPRYTENEVGIEYTPEDFPRYKHSLEKARRLSGFLSSDDSDLLPDITDVCSPSVIAVRGCYGDYIGLISNRTVHRKVLPISKGGKYKGVKPDCTVCFLRADDVPVEKTIDQVLDRLKGSSRIVLFAIPDTEMPPRPEIMERYDIRYAKINCTPNSVRQYVTSALELKIEQYLQSVRHVVAGGTRKDVMLRIDATLKFLIDSSVFLQSKRPPKRFIPVSLRDFLTRNKEFIIQYGFWLDEFRIFMSGIKTPAECADIKSYIEQSLPNTFIWRIKLIRTANFSRKKKPFYGQGDRIGRGPPGGHGGGGPVLADGKSATLGAFVKMHVHNRDEIVALTSGHFIYEDMVAFAYIDNAWRELGTCAFRIQAGEDGGLCEVSIIRLNRNLEVELETMLQSEQNEFENASLYSDAIDECIGSSVYKRGASTLWTEGVVISIQNTVYKGTEHQEQVVLVQSLPDDPGSSAVFAEEGDSGSVVFRYGTDAALESLEIIAMVNCGDTDENIAIDEDGGETSENYVLCTNLQVAFEISEKQGRHLSFINSEQTTTEPNQ